ncbi:MAG: ABC transporter permease [Flavihumibacter sp.]
MLKNFLLVTWRNLRRNRRFSLINISGLGIGMAAAALIMLWLQQEMSYDSFHANRDRIYQAWNRYTVDGNTTCWKNTPQPMGPSIAQDYPEVEKTARVVFLPPYKVDYGDKHFYGRGKVVDSSFLEIFSFPVIKGDSKTALFDPSSVVLTETFAKTIFGEQDPIGQVIRLDNTDQVKVTAVLKELPGNSVFDFKYLLPWGYMRKKGKEDTFWGNNSIDTYVMLKKGATLASVTPKIQSLRKKYDSDDPGMETFLYPMSRWHLYSSFVNGKEEGGRIEMIRLFSIITAFIVLVACINFMNLSTARSEKRAKEVGIRKVVGAQKGSLVMQFLGESVVMAMIAGLLALLIVQFSLPAFNKLVDKKLSISFADPSFWLTGLAFILITGVLAGSYPSLYLSSFQPVRVLKGMPKAVHALVTPRKLMVVMQFSFAIVLIIGTMVVQQQIKKAQSRQTGYGKEQLVYHFTEGESAKNYPLIKRELLATGAAASVTMTSAPVTEAWSSTWNLEWPGKDSNDKTLIDRFCADDAVVKTLGLQLVAGRDLDLNTTSPTLRPAC